MTDDKKHSEAPPAETPAALEPWLLSAEIPGGEALPDWLGGDLPDPPGLVEPPPAPAPVAPSPPPAVIAEAVAAPPARAGKAASRPITYSINLCNSRGPASGFAVRHQLPAGARLVRAEPPVALDGQELVWDLGNLEQGATQQLTVTVEPLPGQQIREKRGVFRATCLYEANVVRPILGVRITAPATVKADEAVPLVVEVANGGSAPAANAVLRLTLSPGLFHADGPTINFTLGNLPPGEVVRSVCQAVARHAGEQSCEAAVTEDGGAAAVGHAAVTVTRPALSVQLAGPADGKVGQLLDYRVEVANPGTAAARSTRVVLELPDGLELTAAPGADYQPERHALAWFVPDLAAGGSRSFDARLKVIEPGDFVPKLSARAAGGLEAAATAAVRCDVDGDGRYLTALVREMDAELSAGPVRPAASSAAATAAEEAHILFALGGTTYGIPMANVVEIERPQAITPVPNVPDWVVGVGNVRGDLVSMVDPGLFFGLDRQGGGRDARVVVVRSVNDEIAVGLLVDRVLGIHGVASAAVRPRPAGDDRLSPYIRGVADQGKRLLVLLDLERLLASNDLRLFELV